MAGSRCSSLVRARACSTTSSGWRTTSTTGAPGTLTVRAERVPRHRGEAHETGRPGGRPVHGRRHDPHRCDAAGEARGRVRRRRRRGREGTKAARGRDARAIGASTSRSISHRFRVSARPFPDSCIAANGPFSITPPLPSPTHRRAIRRAHATPRNAQHPGWAPTFSLRLKVLPELTSARRCGSPSLPFRGYERGVSIFRRHRDGRLDVRQTAARGSSQYRRGGSLLIRELANSQPIMVAKGQIPADELSSYTLEGLATASSRFSGLASIPLTAFEVNRPREM